MKTLSRALLFSAVCCAMAFSATSCEKELQGPTQQDIVGMWEGNEYNVDGDWLAHRWRPEDGDRTPFEQSGKTEGLRQQGQVCERMHCGLHPYNGNFVLGKGLSGTKSLKIIVLCANQGFPRTSADQEPSGKRSKVQTCDNRCVPGRSPLPADITD